MADENISMFVAVTEASPEAAQSFLDMAGGNVEMAVELWMNNPELRSQVAAGGTQAPAAAGTSNRENPITIDDDEVEDDDVRETGSRNVGGGVGSTMEDDEAMARRLQEEMYGAGGGGGAGGMMDDEGVRAPMQRTTETLVGPGSDWRDDENTMRAAIAEQMAARQQRRQGRPGIFNQAEAASIWSEDDPTNPEVHRQVLSRATGGASDQSSKSNLLADLFRPPYEIIRGDLSWSNARDEGKETEKWILVNVQDPSIFDCQVLNRDIWKNTQVQETIKENFIFLQYNKNDPRGQEYVNYYFNNLRDHEDAYPHIAIVDPRTGEQVKTWSGSPAPKVNEFLMDLHEFLDRYSLRMDQKNPVQATRKEKRKDVAEMSEEEMLQMAMQNSLDHGNGAVPREEDPDALTKGDKGKAPAAAAQPDLMNMTEPSTSTAPNGETASREQEASPFAAISSTNPHTEPTSADAAQTTRIQFRYSGGRIIRRFELSDPVRRIYEWLKAAPFEGKENASFDLISSSKNLIEMLETPISEAGLKNGTVMVEFTED